MSKRFASARLIGGRVLSALPILFGVIVLTFVLVRVLPGDPAAFFSSSPNAGKAEVEMLRQQLGLDKSLPQQFLVYLQGLTKGELGISLVSGQPVARDLAERLPATLELALVAFVIGCGIAVPLGVMAALRQGSWIDHLCRLVTSVGSAVPTFFFGLLLILFFFYLLGWAPEPIGRLPAGMSVPPRITGMLLFDAPAAGDWETWRIAAAQIVLPALSMAIFALAPIARMTRASMLGVISSEFVRAARAFGIGQHRVLLRYTLRNALLPVITTLGMVMSTMLGANVMVEKVFSWPGVGSYALDALVSLDYAPVQGYILVVGVLFVLINMVIDIAYSLVDPRVKVEA
ncbi:MAG: ABC transporter permease [Pseudomonadota bacterium]